MKGICDQSYELCLLRRRGKLTHTVVPYHNYVYFPLGTNLWVRLGGGLSGGGLPLLECRWEKWKELTLSIPLVKYRKN